MDQSFSIRANVSAQIVDAPTITISLRGPSHGRRPADQIGAYLPTSDGGVFIGEYTDRLTSWVAMMDFILEAMRSYRDGGQARMTFYIDSCRGASFGFEKPSEENPDSFMVAFFDPPAARS